jgi:hypothetical protein
MFSPFLSAGFDLFILFALSFMLPFLLRFTLFLLLEDARGNLGRMLGTCLACVFLAAIILNLTQTFHDTAFVSLRSTYWASAAGFLTGLILLVLGGKLLRHITRSEPHNSF